MTDNERITQLESRLSNLEKQVNILGQQLSAEKEQNRELRTEVEILKEGGNL